MWKHKSPQITKEILSSKNSARGANLPDFQLYCKARVMGTALCWYITDTQGSGLEQETQMWAYATIAV